MDTSSPTPEGVLIEAARSRAGLSQNAAAERAGITGTHWRTIVRGGVAMTSPRGLATLARMAQVVGVTPDELEQAGRADAADALRSTMRPLSLDEDLTEAERALTRIEKALDARDGGSKRRAALIDALRAEIEESAGG